MAVERKLASDVEHPVVALGSKAKLRKLRAIPGWEERNDRAHDDLTAGKGKAASEVRRPR